MFSDHLHLRVGTEPCDEIYGTYFFQGENDRYLTRQGLGINKDKSAALSNPCSYLESFLPLYLYGYLRWFEGHKTVWKVSN